MRLGLQIADFAWRGGAAATAETLAGIARTAEDAGFDLIGVADHLWQVSHLGGPEQPELECFTALAVLAAQTRRCRLTPLVAAVHLRQPALLAKMVTTLDVLSAGRAMLGIGAGWYAEEAHGLGVPFPPLGARFGMLEETIQICLRMWSGEQGDERPFRGTYYQLERPLNVPQSLSRPHPPLMIGGSGAQKTLRLVARYADACNLYPTPDLPEKLAILRQHCATEGRDEGTIEKTCTVHFGIGADGAGVDATAAELRRLADLGIQTAIGIVRGPDPIRIVDIVGREILPAVADA
ncbi:MAG: LLM class F420-dependent oxidoreductase [Thermomicrobiales bacterium]